MAIKKLAITNTNFMVLIDNNITDINRLVLNRLYYPIIGDGAVNLYYTLYNELLGGAKESDVLNHNVILNRLNISSKKFIEERLKLEAIGLLDTYYKDGLFLYVLKNVLSPAEFFNNEELVWILMNNVPSEEYDNLVHDFIMRKVDPDKFEKITVNFDDVFNFVKVDKPIVNGVNTTNNGIVISNDSFNIEQLVLLLDASSIVNSETLNDAAFLEKIIRYAFLYELTVEEMKDAIKLSVNTDRVVLMEELSYHVRKIYDDKKINKQFIPKKEVIFSDNKLVRKFETSNPSQIIKAMYNTSLTSSEINMFDEVLAETGISVGVLNVLIFNVVKQKNGEIPSRNYFVKIANTWTRAGVKTVEEALKYLGEGAKPANYKGGKNNKKVVQTPDWYKDNQAKEFKEESGELVDIEEFFKTGK